MTLTLVGDAADFRSGSGIGPSWEHTVLLEAPGVTSLALDRFRTDRARRLLQADRLDVLQAIRLGRRLRGCPAVLAQSESSGHVAALATTLVPSRTRLHIIFHGHGWQTRRRRAFAALCRRNPRIHFCALSGSLADILVDELGIPASRVRVTGFGVDAEFFRPEPRSTRKVVVSAGTASRDYRLLADAVRGIDAEVHVAADSTWYRERLNLDGSDAPPNLTLASAGNYANLRALYARASVVVVPLQDVRFACGYAVIAEAMAMGKAVVATRTGAPSDLVEPGVTGLYVPPGDAAALRDAIGLLLADPDRAGAMGDAGRRAVERRFNVRDYAARLLAATALPSGAPRPASH